MITLAVGNSTVHQLKRVLISNVTRLTYLGGLYNDLSTKFKMSVKEY